MSAPTEACQGRYARRWGHLRNSHVRTLAWLLDAPGLLDPDAPEWHGQVAPDCAVSDPDAAWLAGLDAAPQALEAALGERAHTRLGLYAEKLMAFYYRERATLLAHGLQVRASRDDTVGEFDFLLAIDGGALHLEFATKFYLLEPGAGQPDLDSLVGPNLVDSLGKKMRKIMSHQLQLGAHPAAQALLVQPVVQARALVKGWLFYPNGQMHLLPGISAGHCHGAWTTLGQLDQWPGEHFVVLARLDWLAPFRCDVEQACLTRAQLAAVLAEQFARSARPALVASMQCDGGSWVEQARCFVVPDDWPAQAAALS